MNVQNRIILALDFANKQEVDRCLDDLAGHVQYVKVGMELFYAEGPKVVEALKEKGFQVFVDLKVHDIPNTAKGAMRSLAQVGADMVNVHVAGGIKMMEAAKEGLEQGARSGAPRPLLIGVTMLTSTSEQMMNDQIRIPGVLQETVLSYASLAKKAGLDGIVSSPIEVPVVKQVIGEEFITVTPGIRPKGSVSDDQTRITTPEQAFALGSDYIVIGRAITAHPEPQTAWQQMIEAIHCHQK
ncbi:orotidine-5'-phosphate decarboxylase [Brevibacillus sp. SYSU BS000544]|uniref:orotidine-5'-phosphate decarboxylase n=1 Tax=Brevibacillus sp. SYSU BS000544 TaxID=3416443 RepID=UPI003CE48681